MKVSTSASAPVLVDLLQRFANGHDRYGYDSHDDGDAISPVDRGDEEVIIPYSFSFYLSYSVRMYSDSNASCLVPCLYTGWREAATRGCQQ